MHWPLADEAELKRHSVFQERVKGSWLDPAGVSTRGRSRALESAEETGGAAQHQGPVEIAVSSGTQRELGDF